MSQYVFYTVIFIIFYKEIYHLSAVKQKCFSLLQEKTKISINTGFHLNKRKKSDRSNVYMLKYKMIPNKVFPVSVRISKFLTSVNAYEHLEIHMK